MKKFTSVLAMAIVLVFTGSVLAEVIDFENTTEDEFLASISTDTNTVTFESDLPGYEFYIAKFGAPTTAFKAYDRIAEDVGGENFLSINDDFIARPVEAPGYVLRFEKPILNIGLHLYDYRDGNCRAGDTATLIAYSDEGMTEVVGQDQFIAQGRLNTVDGNVEWLEISNPSGTIKAVELVFSAADPGTGIDNITFETMPELQMMIVEPECLNVPAPIVADLEIDSTVKNLHIDQNLRKKRGSIQLILTFPIDEEIELVDGDFVGVKLQLIQDGKIIELTGSKAMRKVGNSKVKLLYRPVPMGKK